jgi:ribose transport system permease protein
VSQKYVRFLQKNVVYLGFVLVFIYFSLTQGQYFLQPSNLLNILVQSSPIAVMAVGFTFVLAAGQIDLSFGSVVALSALVAALTLQETGLWWLAAIAGLSVGATVGLINGSLIVFLRLPSFLVTLATMGIVAGVARVLTNLQSVPVTEPAFVFIFGGGKIGPFSTILVWLAVVTAAGWHVLRQRRFGAHVLAIGNNPGAASASGISVLRNRILVFVVMAAAAALAGLLYAGRLEGARYTLGETDLLTVIAAVIVGGTSLFGGKGSIIGSVVGAMLLSIINNGLIIAGLNVSQQMIVKGVIILLAVSLSLREEKT